MSKDNHCSPSFDEIMEKSKRFMRQASYVREGFKGCQSEISRVPVCLEPSFRSYSCMDFGKLSQMEDVGDLCVYDDSFMDWRYLKIWFAKQDDKFGSEEVFRSLLNKLGALGQKFKVILGGNKERVSLIVGVGKDNVGPARNAVESIYPRSELELGV